MAFRLYIVPVVGVAGNRANPPRPKYFLSDASGQGVTPIIAGGQSWSGVDYGLEKWMVVGADLTSSDDLLVVGQADAFALPVDLGVQLNAAQVTSVKAKLEAINVPAGWVTAALTWVVVVRKVLGMFSWMQRVGQIYYDATGQFLNVFSASVSLDTAFGSLPQAVQDAMTGAAQSFSFSTAGLTSGTTLRVILKAMADNFANQQYSFNGTLI